MAEHGITLALDDFGTGYSSLSRLKRFRLDVLKIDRSFVAGIEGNIDDRAIVKATIDMAHAVGLTVVAEGVETREQEETLRGFGCDRAPGLPVRATPACGGDHGRARRGLSVTPARARWLGEVGSRRPQRGDRNG